MGVPVRPGTPSHRTGPAGPGRDGRLAPGRSRCERGDMAGAMASAISAVKLLSPHVRAGSGNAARFPARADRCHQDPCTPHQQRPAPDPAGEKRPPGAGSGAGRGLWPPAGQGSAWRCGRGDGLCHCSGEGPFASEGGIRKRIAFPPPARDGPLQPGRSGKDRGQRPTRRGRSARHGRGGRWPGALGPRPVLIPAWRCGRGDGPCH